MLSHQDLDSSSWASLVAQRVKHLPTMRETRVRSLGWEDRLEKQWQPTPVLLPGKSHGLRSLVGYSPWGPKGSDTTERLHFHFLLLKTQHVTITGHGKGCDGCFCCMYRLHIEKAFVKRSLPGALPGPRHAERPAPVTKEEQNSVLLPAQAASSH